MKMKHGPRLPEVPELERELEREQYKMRYRQTLKSTVFTLITVAAAAVLIATLWLPVLRIYGNSMTPTLNNGQIVLSWKTKEPDTEDIVAFYYNNKVLVKRRLGGHRRRGQCLRERRSFGGTVFNRKSEGRVRHRAAVSGAGKSVFRYGRSQKYIGRFAKHRGWLYFGGSACGAIGSLCLAV